KFKPSAEMFKELEAMEWGHKQILEKLQADDLKGFTPPKITDLHISDYLYEPPVSSGMVYQEVLIVAMKREEIAQKMYNDLAGKIDDNFTKNLFVKLATEEAKHKFQLETLYDEVINIEN
ncbi:MAG: ferritin family protein, partial [FCB group bacterium]